MDACPNGCVLLFCLPVPPARAGVSPSSPLLPPPTVICYTPIYGTSILGTWQLIAPPTPPPDSGFASVSGHTFFTQKGSPPLIPTAALHPHLRAHSSSTYMTGAMLGPRGTSLAALRLSPAPCRRAYRAYPTRQLFLRDQRQGLACGLSERSAVPRPPSLLDPGQPGNPIDDTASAEAGRARQEVLGAHAGRTRGSWAGRRAPPLTTVSRDRPSSPCALPIPLLSPLS